MAYLQVEDEVAVDGRAAETQGRDCAAGGRRFQERRGTVSSPYFPALVADPVPALGLRYLVPSGVNEDEGARRQDVQEVRRLGPESNAAAQEGTVYHLSIDWLWYIRKVRKPLNSGSIQRRASSPNDRSLSAHPLHPTQGEESTKQTQKDSTTKTKTQRTQDMVRITVGWDQDGDSRLLILLVRLSLTGLSAMKRRILQS